MRTIMFILLVLSANLAFTSADVGAQKKQPMYPIGNYNG